MQELFPMCVDIFGHPLKPFHTGILSKVFSCEEAALEVQMSVCLSSRVKGEEQLSLWNVDGYNEGYDNNRLVIFINMKAI